LDRLSSFYAALSARIRELWAAQNATARTIAVGLVALLAVAGIVLTVAYGPGRKPAYDVLFANLSADDAASVTAKLTDDKVPYEISGETDHTTIKVPADRVADERVQLAGTGVVKGGGTGYELFDRTNFGMTDFQERIAKIRATEGELQRTIAGLAPVQSARVHIAAPEASLYSSTQSPTTASIAIVTRPSMNLAANQVRGITQLVANAVENLKPENVTIVNQDGAIISANTTPGSTDAAAQADALHVTMDQYAAKQKYEENLQQSIQGLLDDTLGKGRAAARVSTDMKFDMDSTESKQYAPAGTTLSEQTEKETYNGNVPGRTAVGGIAGTTANAVPTYQGQQPGAATGRMNRNKSTRNYDVGITQSKHTDAPGKVVRQSVAVLVNVPAVSANGNNANPTFSALAPADIAKIKNVVSAAAGIDPARGDLVSVEAIPFAAAPVASGGFLGSNTTTVLGIPVVPLAIVAGLLLLGGVGALAMVARRRNFRPDSADLPSFDSSLAEELPSFEEHPMLESVSGLAAPIRSAADLTREQMMEFVTTVSQENPENIAKLVKLWLAE
jgi:flagellar M-ring protein FliF